MNEVLLKRPFRLQELLASCLTWIYCYFIFVIISLHAWILEKKIQLQHKCPSLHSRISGTSQTRYFCCLIARSSFIQWFFKKCSFEEDISVDNPYWFSSWNDSGTTFFSIFFAEWCHYVTANWDLSQYLNVWFGILKIWWLFGVQVLLVTGLNRKFGISDEWFAIGDSLILTVLGQVILLIIDADEFIFIENTCLLHLCLIALTVLHLEAFFF